MPNTNIDEIKNRIKEGIEIDNIENIVELVRMILDLIDEVEYLEERIREKNTLLKLLRLAEQIKEGNIE